MIDSYLVERAQRGDHAAFTRLVAEHQAMVYRLCYRVTGRPDDAEELAHEACVEAFLKLGQLRDPARFTAWLRAITLNLCRMWLRGRTADVATLDDALPAAAAEPDGLAGRVSQGLTRLSAPHRLALVLHYREGLSYDEIAAVLDIPVGTVMSRLHRGRRELKRLVESMDDEEMPTMPDDEFTHEVDAEISVLLTLFKADPDAAERLSILLAHAPERLAALIAETDDAETLAHLARLLPRLGKPAIEIALNSALLGDAATRERAIRLLRAFTARVVPGIAGQPPWLGTPPFGVYRLLDGLTRSTAPARRKAELLAALLDAADDGPTQALLANVLVCDPDAALAVLLARFRAPEDAPVNVPVLAALARMGTRFLAAVLEDLTGRDPARQALALQGVEAVARALAGRHEDARCARRYAAKWAPIPAAYCDGAVLEAAVTRITALLEAPRAEVRDAAIRVLGLLKRAECRVRLEALARDGETSSRVAAVRALTEIGAPESVPVLLAAAADDAARPARIAAIEGLGRLGQADMVPALIRLLADGDGAVRQAAAAALGDIGGEDAREMLQRLMTAADKPLARTAATVLHTSPHFRKRRPPNAALQAMDREVRRRLHGEVARPCAFISLHEAIAALPEVRPYDERELTRLIARASHDYATTRRLLIVEKLMRRDAGIYELTDIGEAVWRVERFIAAHYLA